MTNSKTSGANPSAIRLLQRIDARLSDDDVSNAPLDTRSARAALSWLRGMFGKDVRDVIGGSMNTPLHIGDDTLHELWEAHAVHSFAGRMSHTTIAPGLAVEIFWRDRGITDCILAEERIAIHNAVLHARAKFWGRPE